MSFERSVDFNVEGTPVSANRVTRRVGNKSLKSREAREYQARVASHARIAMLGQEYFDGAISVVIICYNVRLDIDNLAKCILDGMQGVVYTNDKKINYMTISKVKDPGKQRVCITIREELTHHERNNLP